MTVMNGRGFLLDLNIFYRQSKTFYKPPFNTSISNDELFVLLMDIINMSYHLHPLHDDDDHDHLYNY